MGSHSEDAAALASDALEEVLSNPFVGHHVGDGASACLFLEAGLVSGLNDELLVASLVLEALVGLLEGAPNSVSESSASLSELPDGAHQHFASALVVGTSGLDHLPSSLEEHGLDHLSEASRGLSPAGEVLLARFAAMVTVSSAVVLPSVLLAVSLGVGVLLAVVLPSVLLAVSLGGLLAVLVLPSGVLLAVLLGGVLLAMVLLGGLLGLLLDGLLGDLDGLFGLLSALVGLS